MKIVVLSGAGMSAESGLAGFECIAATAAQVLPELVGGLLEAGGRMGGTVDD